MLKATNNPEFRKIKDFPLECGYEIKENHWVTEGAGFFFLFKYVGSMLYLAVDERYDNLESNLRLIAVNSNPIERIRLKDILTLLTWTCDDYWEGD